MEGREKNPLCRICILVGEEEWIRGDALQFLIRGDSILHV
jgi:hypothetical protein